MLTSLSIRNYALIEELSIELPAGLVILTGETGAGKSIIIDALGLILGERAGADVVRAGADRAVVEAVIHCGAHEGVGELLAAAGIDAGPELILRRELTSRGQSRCFINDTPVQLAVLRRTGDVLVDLHGQHEHQSLLRTEHHLRLLDAFAELEPQVAEFRTAHHRFRDAAERLRLLRERDASARERSDILSFQHRDIMSVDPVAGEEEMLGAELRVLENSERLIAATGSAVDMLSGQERSAHDLLVLCRNTLRDLAAIDPRLEDTAREAAAAEVIVGELARSLQRYNDSLESRPERLEFLRDRLTRLAALKRKYGGSLEAVLAHRDRIAADLALAEGAEGEIRALADEAAAAYADCVRLAGRLSAARRDAAKTLDRAVTAELRRLGIANPRFVTTVRDDTAGGSAPAPESAPGVRRFNDTGWDEVEFLLSTNLGEDPRPLVRVASGGEVSRIMLALKTVLAGGDRLPVLVFDEIDTGVSGRIARVVGMSLKNLACRHQVIAITHLPQIAGLADAHFIVEKEERNGRTSTRLRRLSDDGRVEEVARLLSGAAVTAAGLRGARELMKTDEER